MRKGPWIAFAGLASLLLSLHLPAGWWSGALATIFVPSATA